MKEQGNVQNVERQLVGKSCGAERVRVWDMLTWSDVGHRFCVGFLGRGCYETSCLPLSPHVSPRRTHTSMAKTQTIEGVLSGHASGCTSPVQCLHFPSSGVLTRNSEWIGTRVDFSGEWRWSALPFRPGCLPSPLRCDWGKVWFFLPLTVLLRHLVEAARRGASSKQSQCRGEQAAVCTSCLSRGTHENPAWSRYHSE